MVTRVRVRCVVFSLHREGHSGPEELFGLAGLFRVLSGSKGSSISEGFFSPEGPTVPDCYSKVAVLSEEQRRVIAEKRATAKLRRAAASQRRRPQPKAASVEWRRASGISQESPVQTVFLDLVSVLSFAPLYLKAAVAFRAAQE